MHRTNRQLLFNSVSATTLGRCAAPGSWSPGWSLGPKFAQELSKWTRTRLEARHVGSKGMLIEDAAQLGVALERIPGPGITLPLDADDYSLPSPDDVEGLSKEVEILGRRIFLSSAGGVR